MSKARVLVVDDERSLAETLAEGLEDCGYDAVAAAGGIPARALLGKETFDVLVTDLRMPDLDGLALLAASKALAPSRPVIVMTAYGAIDTAIEAIRQGAYHYLTKPFKVDELSLFVARALDEAAVRLEAATLKKNLRDRFSLANVLGRSVAMREVLDVVERVLDVATPLLIVGETGTGKGLLARAIHAQSERATRPFVTVNCAALPENLLESELFGHVKGAFTGATGARAGLIMEAGGGTIFLDEIGEMPLGLQTKLLDVLERSVVRSVGSDQERRVEARFLVATHRDLRRLVAEGRFREDLLYRLDVVTIELPPLRLRRDDIPDLIDHFLTEARARHTHSPVERFSAAAMRKLLEYDWPGNVRELEHTVERAVLLGRSAEIGVDDTSLRGRDVRSDAPAFSGPVVPVREMQSRYAAWALEQLGGRKLVTAEALGIDDKTLARWLAREPEGK